MSGSPIIRSDELRSNNKHRLLRSIRHSGPCSPAESAQLSGLSPASVSQLTAGLIDQGVLLSSKHPASRQKSGRGRPLTQLSLNPQAGYCIVVTFTIDLLRLQRVNYAGEICAEEEHALDTRTLAEEELLQSVCRCIRAMIPPAEQHRLHHIGVAFQGVTEHLTGTLLWSPIISGKQIPLGHTLSKEFGVPCSVNNDCRLISQALSQTHRDTLGHSFATVLFSYGIGLGLFLEGQSFSGTRSSALEIGHWQFEHKGALCRCGKRGCIEAYAADYGIERMANGQSLEDAPAGRVPEQQFSALIDQARQGERAAMQAFTIAGAAVGEGLANLFTLLDPMPVALVGRDDEAFNLMRGGIETIVKQNCLHTPSDIISLHYFANQDPLLSQGLISHTLSEIDALFSRSTLVVSS